jgi:predicted aspartyl protease
MTVPIRINGQGPFAFVVDTGANQSVISLELAAKLGLPVGLGIPLNGVAGVMDEPTTRATFDIGGRAQSERMASLLPAAAIGGDGMLGLDGLDGQRLTLDFARQSLLIDDGSRHAWDPDEVVIKARRRDGQLTLVDVDLAGLRLTAFLDSGAQSTIGNLALRQLALTRTPTSHWTQTPIISATGQTIMAEMADLPDLRIGKLRMPNWPVAFADLHTFQMWNMTDRPAILLGVDILSRFEYVSLDFARDEVRFRLPHFSA